VAAGRYPAPVRAAWQDWGHVVLLTVALVPLAATVVAAYLHRPVVASG
jgi:hypothetical protein